jgi:hypothetical protein
MLLPLEMLIF